MKKLITICLMTVVCLGTSDALSNWTEVGDAGDLPGIAQIVTGSGTLTTITGELSNNTDADMFQIFISNPAGFSAFAASYDPQLFLFDASGMGIYANDDFSNGDVDAFLPSGNTNSPTSAGLYYLAISGYDFDPASAGGLIFPSSPFNGVFGPTGLGGGSPISSWTGSGTTGEYTITLTGAEHVGNNVVPAPGAILLGGIGVSLVGWMRRRRTL